MAETTGLKSSAMKECLKARSGLAVFRFQRPIRLEIHGYEGAPMTVVARDEQGRVAEVASKLKLEKAEKRPFPA